MTTISEIVDAAAAADAKYGHFASMHEAYGVLAEEVDELFEAVKMKQETHGIGPDGKLASRGQCIRAEAIQVAAVALRIAMQAERCTR